MAKARFLDLGKRERQIVEVVYQLAEASVSEVLNQLADPPSYSSVRAMLGLLVDKNVLKYRRQGKRYFYRPALAKEKASRSAMQNLLTTFFGGQATDAMVALLDLSAADMSDEDFERIKRLVQKAQKENQ